MRLDTIMCLGFLGQSFQLRLFERGARTRPRAPCAPAAAQSGCDDRSETEKGD